MKMCVTVLQEYLRTIGPKWGISVKLIAQDSGNPMEEEVGRL